MVEVPGIEPGSLASFAQVSTCVDRLLSHLFNSSGQDLNKPVL